MFAQRFASAMLVPVLLVVLCANDCPDTTKDASSLWETGRALYLAGSNEKALSCFHLCTVYHPSSAAAWTNYGTVLVAEQQTHDAISSFTTALSLEPTFSEAYYGLGKAMRVLRRFDEAQTAWSSALDLNPSLAELVEDIAALHLERGHVQLALEIYEKHIASTPTPFLLSNYGVLLKEYGDVNAALSVYERALTLDPTNPVHYYRIGNARLKQHRLEDALEAFRGALLLDGGFAAAYNNMGTTLQALGRHTEAEEAFRFAVKANPSDAAFLSNLGTTVQRSNPEEAIGIFRRVLTLDPTVAEGYGNLGNALKDIGKLTESAQAYEHALSLLVSHGAAESAVADELAVMLATVKQQLCHWADFDPLSAAVVWRARRAIAQGDRPALSPFYATAFPSVSAELSLAISSAYASSLDSGSRFPLSATTLSGLGRDTLRLGFLSSDLTAHIVGHGIAALLQGLKDFKGIESHCFATQMDDSNNSRVIRQHSSVFHHVVSVPHTQLASLINAAGVHILFDVNGHTRGNSFEVVSMRPAPVQVLFHGYAGTMGSDAVQYVFSDRVASPPDFQAFFYEKLLLLPSFFLAERYAQAQPWTESPSRTEVGLPEDAVLMCNFNSLYKVDATVFDVWMTLLRQFPTSVLWLLHLPAEAEANLRKRARRLALSDSRLVFTPLSPRETHLNTKSLCDVFVDTPVYNGHASCADALWAGVPVVTLPNEKMASRVCASLLHAAGITAGITSSLSSYHSLLSSLLLNLSSSHRAGPAGGVCGGDVGWGGCIGCDGCGGCGGCDGRAGCGGCVGCGGDVGCDGCAGSGGCGDNLGCLRSGLRRTRGASLLFDRVRWLAAFVRSARLMWEVFVSEQPPVHVAVCR